MDTFYAIPFTVLEIPRLRLKKPSWVQTPSPMFMFIVVMISYFLVTAGIIYDVIIEPPSIGQTTDDYGHPKPVAFLPYRVNGQYIMEGLAASFLFSLGGMGFVILDKTNQPLMPRFNRIMLLFIGFISIILSFFVCRLFMGMKLPGYLRG